MADSVLINSPDCWDMGGQQLVLGQSGVTSSGTNKASLPDSIVSHHNTLYCFYVGSFVVHSAPQYPVRGKDLIFSHTAETHREQTMYLANHRFLYMSHKDH